MISQTTFPPDIRLEKEIKSLSETGYQVLVVCNQYDKGLNPDFSYCEIKRVNALFNSSWLNRIINFPIFFNPRYLTKIYTCILRFKPDYIHAHDLPMMPIAIFFGKIFRLPVIFDMHENYPEALKQFDKKGVVNFIFKNYHLAKILEKFCLKYSDRIIVVVEENKTRLVSISIKPDIIFVVSNTVDLDSFTETGNSYKKVDLYNDNKTSIIYTGTISPDRGLMTAIQSASYFNELDIQARLYIIGDGTYKKKLTEFVIKNDLGCFVTLVDWPGHNFIPSYIKGADICMIPQPENEFINTTIPHKLFEYMLMEKPVLVSNAAPLRRIIEETKAGVIFKSNDPLDFAKKVKLMLTSNEDWGRMGHNAIITKYNWSVDSKELLRVYDSFNFV